MTDNELDMAVNWIRSQGWSEENLPSDELLQMEQAYIAGLAKAEENYSKIYMQGRLDERERPSSLCNNPNSICIRCSHYKSLCDGSDLGVYIGKCKDFSYMEVTE